MDTDGLWKNPSIQADSRQSHFAAVDVAEVPQVDVRNGRETKAEILSTSISAPNTKSGHRCVSAPLPDHCDVTDDDDSYSETSRLVNSRPGAPDHSSDNSDAGHCHDNSNKDLLDKRARNKLIAASLLCLIFMTAEAVGGLLAGSLAIVSDAAHLLTDFASFLISLLAIYLRTRPATKKLSFGWYRAEILGALMSILVLWVLTGILVYSAVERVISERYEINAEIMLITAAVGVAFNLTLGLILHQHVHTPGSHGHSHTFQPSIQTDKKISYGSIVEEGAPPRPKRRESNINVTAAFIHVLGDFVQSIGVLIAAFIIYFEPDYKIADPICTFVFSAFVLVTTMAVLRDILVVLMEGTPRSVNFSEVRRTFFEIPGIKDVHNLRVWSLTLNKTALSVHIAIEKGYNPLLLIKQASHVIKLKYGITETTMQMEEYVDEMLDCTRCQDLKD